MSEEVAVSPSVFIDMVTDELMGSFAGFLVVGEVASFKVNQGKWVFFDLKDDEASVPCFMPVWSLNVPIEDGMKIAVRGTPKVTRWGKFSMTVSAVKPVGEGSLKKAYELLKKKLSAEGLFDLARKRALPEDLKTIGVISSRQAAGYADFVKILNARWGGMKIVVAHTQVQGMEAPEQIIRALSYFNEHGGVDVIAILRGGGSADDLSCFNDERLVRAVASSKIPVITGIGHEVDESLCDLVADVRASTPSNAAEMLSRDRVFEQRRIAKMVEGVSGELVSRIEGASRENRGKVLRVSQGLMSKYIEPVLTRVREGMKGVLGKMQSEERNLEGLVREKMRILEVLNPEKVLRQGYAILAGKVSPGNVVKITTFEKEIKAEIKEVYEREAGIMLMNKKGDL